MTDADRTERVNICCGHVACQRAVEQAIADARAEANREVGLLLQEIDTHPMKGRCSECGHAQRSHNDLGYCQVGQCTCGSGWSLADRVVRVRAALSDLESDG